MKTKEEELKEENRRLKREINNLKLQMRSKETIVKNIIKKLGIILPYDNFANNFAFYKSKNHRSSAFRLAK